LKRITVGSGALCSLGDSRLCCFESVLLWKMCVVCTTN